MVLQELLFPNYETCACYEMYFRLQGVSSAAADVPLDQTRELIYFDHVGRRLADIRYDNIAQRRAYYDPQAGQLRMSCWQTAGFDTYFNSFAIGKWRKYTCLSDLKLQLDLKGSFQVTVLHMYSMYTQPFENIIGERVCRARDKTTFEFDIPYSTLDRGIVCFRLYSLEEDDNVYYGGRYVTTDIAQPLNPVDIAVDICTYRRERFVERNIALLEREIIRNAESPLYGHLDVFISDNGQTLNVEALQSDRVHVFPNKNVGGAGGFARGMVEILKMSSARPFTHVLVMDDDVLIHADAIVRTYRLLQFLKPEYTGKTVAGAMLRLDDRSKQHECCGLWDGFVVHNYKMLLDLTDIKDILFNENEDLPNYNAWWYSCIPMRKITENGLPLPIFIRYDDVEYGLRTGGDIIAMSGICLWHEPFEYKCSPSTLYYEMRNLLIINALRLPDYNVKSAILSFRFKLKYNIGRYRYSGCDLLFRAVEDFCKGPEHLLHTDGEALHQQIAQAAEPLLPLDQLSVHFDELEYMRSQKKETRSQRRARYLTLNRNLCLRRGTSVVDAALNGVKDFAGKKSVLNYDVGSHRGYVSHYSRKRLIGTMIRSRRTARLLKSKFSQACRAWRQAEDQLTSMEFWESYLDLK